MPTPKLKFLGAVSPQPGNLYTEILFRQARKTICFSPVTGRDTAALEVRIFPYGFGAFKFTWSELTTKKRAEEDKKEDGTKKYDSYREFLNSNEVIGYRTEYVPFFKEVEAHPFVVESTSSVDGVSTELVINIITEISFPSDGGPLKILSLKDPLGFVFGFVNEAILRWANAQSSKEVRNMNADKSLNPLNDIQIDGEFYLDYLNKHIFNKYEIRVSNVNLQLVVLSAGDKPVLDAEKSVVIAASGALAAVETKKQRVTLSEAKDAENKVDLSLFAGKLKAKEDFLTKTAESLKIINSGYGANNTQLKVLAIGDNNKLLNDLIIATEAVAESN